MVVVKVFVSMLKNSQLILVSMQGKFCKLISTVSNSRREWWTTVLWACLSKNLLSMYRKNPWIYFLARKMLCNQLKKINKSKEHITMVLLIRLLTRFNSKTTYSMVMYVLDKYLVSGHFWTTWHAKSSFCSNKCNSVNNWACRPKNSTSTTRTKKNVN